MSIFRRGKKYCIGYSLNGRWVRKTIGISKRAAELAEKEIRLKIAKGKYFGFKEPKKISFDELREEYLQYSEANKAPRSFRRDQISLNNLLVAFRDQLISEVTAHDLEIYKNTRKSRVKAATVNRELSCIKHMFKKAVDWGYLSHNPFSSVDRFKEPPGRVRYLTEDEIKKLVDSCAEHLRPIVIMALNTGMRKGEILNLKWADVDMINRFIKISNSKNNEARHVPINDALYAVLTDLLKGHRNDEKVFAWKNGKPIKSIDNGFYRAMKRAGIVDFKFHDMRHTFASHLAMKGVDRGVLQQLLGHKTPAMTMRYTHLSNECLRQAVDKLSATGYNASADRTNTAHLGNAKK